MLSFERRYHRWPWFPGWCEIAYCHTPGTLMQLIVVTLRSQTGKGVSTHVGLEMTWPLYTDVLLPPPSVRAVE